MLQDDLLLILSLLFAVSMFGMISEKLKISYPIILVIAGLLISFIPGVPGIILQPDLVFVIFLPPLLYFAAWNTSWAQFWKFRASIGRLAFGLVITTACGVAFIAHALIPGFSYELGFLLGAIISPPDAVAATSVLHNLKIPRKVVSILEGESLINDATSLVIFKLALLSLLTNQFHLLDAGTKFVIISSLGIVTGVFIAFLIYLMHRFLPTTATIDAVITLITPYLMYVTAEHFEVSGVLSVVSGGLFLSYRSAEIFPYSSRLRVTTVWTVLEFLLNGLVFILIGLQLPEIVKGLGNYSFAEAIRYALIISLATIVIRLFWVCFGGLVGSFIARKWRKNKAVLGWKPVFVIGWSGMRGIVSLASALALPLTLANGMEFPHRSLILFITFVVILVTLVIQGLSLPLILKWLHMEVRENDYHCELKIRIRLANLVVDYLDQNCSKQVRENNAFQRLKEKYERMVKIANESSLVEEPQKPEFLQTYYETLFQIIAIRRKELNKMQRNKEFPDHLLRAKERELDFEEARIRRF